MRYENDIREIVFNVCYEERRATEDVLDDDGLRTGAYNHLQGIIKRRVKAKLDQSVMSSEIEPYLLNAIKRYEEEEYQ